MKYLSIIIATIFLFSCQSRPKAPAGEALPDFDLLLVDSTTRLNTASIKEGQPIAILYFSPDCEHCQAETEGLLKHMSTMKDTRFYFVTIDPFERMQAFSGYYKLASYPNITVGKDEQFFFLRHFKDAVPPSVFLYDRQKRQCRAFLGQTSVDTLVKTISQL